MPKIATSHTFISSAAWSTIHCRVHVTVKLLYNKIPISPQENKIPQHKFMAQENFLKKQNIWYRNTVFTTHINRDNSDLTEYS